MKVLMFGWEFPPYNSGGLGVACQGMARALSENGVEVVFVLPKKIPTFEKFKFYFAKDVFLDMYEVGSNLSPYTTSEICTKMGISESIYGSTLFEEVIRYAKEARKIVKKENFDIIHAHDWLSFVAGMEAKRLSGRPLIAHVHATEFDRSGDNINPLVYKIEKEGMMQADKVVTVSEFTKKLIIDRYGIDPYKITVVHNGINASDYPDRDQYDQSIERLKKAGYKIVLFLGRITLQKGPDYFVKAAKKVLQYAPKTMFIVVGSGDMEGKTMQMAADLGISQNMLFIGFLRDAERSRVYHSADAYIMPSVSEPFGITALESLLHKTPVIMSKQSGSSEVILHSLKTDFWDTDEMADKILSVLNYPSLRKEMVKNGRKEVESSTWENSAQKLHNLYRTHI